MRKKKAKFCSTILWAACVLVLQLVVTLGGAAKAAVASDTCSYMQLKKVVGERPLQPSAQRRRVSALSAGLSCPNISEYPMVAAAAAYELSLFYTGTTGIGPADIRRAIEYAAQSAELLRSTDDKELWFKTRLAVVRLRMYDAQDIDALLEIRRGLDSLLTESQGTSRVGRADAEFYKVLAELNATIFDRGDPSARVAAIKALDRYLGTEAGREQTQERANALETKARLLVTFGSRDGGGRAHDLDPAVSAFEEAIELYRKLGSKDDRVRTQVNLAMAYVQGEGTRFSENLEMAIAILKRVLKELSPRRDRDAYVGAASNLGSAFMARQVGEHNQNMLKAVKWFQLARTQLDPKKQEEQVLWIRSSVNLAMALAATKVAEETNLQDADDILTETIAWLEERKRFTETVKPLAIQASVRLTWASWGRAEQLDAAGALLAKADERATHLPAAQRALLQADRGEYLRYRFAAGDVKALDQAVVAYRAAIALTDRRASPSVWASMQNNLGNVCNAKSRPDLYQCAFDAYQQALLVRTEAAMPQEHADTLVNLANLEFENANWQQAAELYTSVAQRHRGMFEMIEQREVLLTAAGQSKRWFERAAYALAKQGRAEEGLWIAEQGKTRLLKRRLGLKDLAENIVPRRGFDDIHAAVGRLVLVPIVTTQGGVVFSLFQSPHGWVVMEVFLDGLNANTVVAFMQGERQVTDSMGGWLGTYQDFVRDGDLDKSIRQSWNGKLRESQAWLGMRLVQPVFAALAAKGISPISVAWITQGELAILPMHVALMADGKPLFEHMPVMYAPSLLMLRQPLETPKARQRKDLALVAVGNPTSKSPLPFADVEARSTFSRLPYSRARLFTGGQATSANVKQALPRAQVFHFAGHASFNREHPTQSHLLFSNKQRLTVADLQTTVGDTGPDLAILSACESGLIQIYDIANEFQGLPAAFLGLGSQGVVSTLWPVDDRATLFLVDRLMEAKIVRNRPVPDALREAQLWLRDARGEELLKAARRLLGLARNSVSKAELTALVWRVEHQPHWQPFKDPTQWAGFFYSGRDLHEIRQ
ncbi:CHAT domain-containing protein [Janthinobacterium sp. PC23-8]|uniref:CHAT domain-containing protein n=1 Tax=Janthinobacterium sp. PC23-8 TaxID=2012679 RepID=UPI000B979A96|nr:CHAT domain-containing protein [Janthinobacterium sp. PC23-8]OYO29767.1 hypothetical protein CD932_00420 [Janthinobacterium sp. PC23-8]